MNEHDAEALVAIIRELSDVVQWYQSFYHDVQATTPEYFENCGDMNATMYLYNEAGNIRDRALALINER